MVEQIENEIVVTGTNVAALGEIVLVQLCTQNNECPEPTNESDQEWRFVFGSTEEAATCISSCWASVHAPFEGIFLSILMPNG